MKKYSGLIISTGLIAFAAISKALVDTVAFHHGGIFKSDFFNINKQGNMLPFTSYPFDAFHIFNSLMILSFIVATLVNCNQKWYWKLLIYSATFILVFNLFWEHIFN